MGFRAFFEVLVTRFALLLPAQQDNIISDQLSLRQVQKIKSVRSCKERSDRLLLQSEEEEEEEEEDARKLEQHAAQFSVPAAVCWVVGCSSSCGPRGPRVL